MDPVDVIVPTALEFAFVPRIVHKLAGGDWTTSQQNSCWLELDTMGLEISPFIIVDRNCRIRVGSQRAAAHGGQHARSERPGPIN